MSSHNDDFFGGMFDFNGDGKTTPDEEYWAYQLYEEMNKEDTDKHGDTYEDTYIPSWHTVPKATRSKTQKTVAPPEINIPEVITEAEYPRIKSALKTDIFADVFAALVVTVPTLIVMWATVSSYQPNPYIHGPDYAYSVIFLFVFGLGLAVLVTAWKSAIVSICRACSKLRELKKKYRELRERDE